MLDNLLLLTLLGLMVQLLLLIQLRLLVLDVQLAVLMWRRLSPRVRQSPSVVRTGHGQMGWLAGTS